MPQHLRLSIFAVVRLGERCRRVCLPFCGLHVQSLWYLNNEVWPPVAIFPQFIGGLSTLNRSWLGLFQPWYTVIIVLVEGYNVVSQFSLQVRVFTDKFKPGCPW